MNIFIAPGFAEGRWHTQRLQNALKKYGYGEAEDADTADIIVTHSAGCFFLPNTTANKLVIMINPPYWPGKFMIVSAVQKLWRDFKAEALGYSFGYWATKLFWNYVYILQNILRVFQIAKNVHLHSFHEALQDKRAVFIRSDNDPWLMPNPGSKLPSGETYKLYTTPGEHEDCWLYPDKHAALIASVIQENVIE